MIRKMFKSQLKDEDYDLFFLVGFKRNQFLHDLTSEQLVNKDKVLMKEFQKFNDLGKISYKDVVRFKKIQNCRTEKTRKTSIRFRI